MKLRTALLSVGLLLGLRALGPTIPNANAQTVTILHSFGVPTDDGTGPVAGLVQGSDGNFYGTTSTGGSNTLNNGPTYGTVFRISPSSTYTTLYRFVGYPSDGAIPKAGLVQGSDGDFYGTTYQGGTGTNCQSGCGTVFRISPSGSYTSLYSFAGYPNDGANPSAALIQGSDGNFYGTTFGGGGNGGGTVFRISAGGNEMNLYSFGSFPSDGGEPTAALVQGGDGDFYGTTTASTDGGGTVFRISPSGSFTNLSFIGRRQPFGFPLSSAGLVAGNDGNFYGTTVLGGNAGRGQGMVFRISPGGSVTNLYSFTSNGDTNDGRYPVASLVQGSDGNFYGTTTAGGMNNCFNQGGGNLGSCGTLFRISPSGSYTNLYSFGSIDGDGVNPYAPLMQGSDGNFYGTTYQGGDGFTGTVFKLTVSLNPPANQISAIQFFSLFDSIGVGASIPSVAGETYQLQYTDSMFPTNWINTGGSLTSIGGPMNLFDFGGVLPQQRFYRVVITP